MLIHLEKSAEHTFPDDNHATNRDPYFGRSFGSEAQDTSFHYS